MKPVMLMNANETEDSNFTTTNALNTLCLELEKGIQNIESGEVYTLEEAWEEIDQI